MAASPTLTARLARSWFPAALVLLLLLALPGVILFALHVLGFEGRTNTWLQEHLRLSYHMPLPWWAGLILLFVPLLLLLLYFLKLKRRPMQVPSTFLWKKSIEDLHVNSLFQWLRENVLLLLQLLVLLGLLYSLMGFQFHGSSSQGKHYIVMVDNSASMNATDVDPHRLAQAKQQALDEIKGHPDNDTGMVIVFNSSAEILQSYTNDRSLLEKAVRSIEPTQRPTRLEEALALAESLANPTRSTEDAASKPAGEDPSKARTYVAAEGQPTEVHLFSDGRFPDVADFVLGNLDLRYHAVGQPGPDAVDNVGLVTLNAVRDDRDPGKIQVLARALNYRPQEANVRIVLEVKVNGELRGIYEEPADGSLSLPRRTQVPLEENNPDGPKRDVPGQGYVTFQVSDLDDRSHFVLHAYLKNHKDSFPLDDQAWLPIGVVRKAKIAIAGNDNTLLNAFFTSAATKKVADVTFLSPADLKDQARYGRPAREGVWDLVIFDRCAPATEDDMPSANTYFIDAVPPPFTRPEGATLKNPPIKGWLSRSPIMSYLRGLHEVGIAEAFRFDLEDPRVPPRTPRLLESDKNTVLLFTLPRQAYTDLVQTFPLLDSEGRFNTTWPLHPSFPLFLRNVTYTLGNVSDAAGEENTQPGQVKTLRPDVPVKEIEVTTPDGQTVKLERGTRPDFAFGKTDRVGVYQVSWGGEHRRDFAVNLLDVDESNLEPRPEIQVGDAVVQAGAARGTPRDTWKWVALAALGLLMLEWYIYNKRVYI